MIDFLFGYEPMNTLVHYIVERNKMLPEVAHGRTEPCARESSTDVVRNKLAQPIDNHRLSELV
jgi:hypothetical protein